MKPFETFGEYMFDLLFAPLQRGKRAVNQLFIFCRVAGREFDDLKETLIRVRDEANLATASEIMLPIHGQDRDMPRLAGEDAESYRTRLMAKGSIAELGGLKEGILYALAALGYGESAIESFSYKDPDRWAEFVVYLGHGSPTAIREMLTIYNEIQKVKEASSRLAYFVFIDTPPLNGSLYIGSQVTSYASTLLNTADTIVLIRDRQFDSALSLGAVVSSYGETCLTDENSLILVRDRCFEPALYYRACCTSYKEEVLVRADGLILVQDRIIEKQLSAVPITTSYKEEFLS